MAAASRRQRINIIKKPRNRIYKRFNCRAHDKRFQSIDITAVINYLNIQNNIIRGVDKEIAREMARKRLMEAGLIDAHGNPAPPYADDLTGN